MDGNQVMMIIGVTTLGVGCYVASLKMLYKCKFSNISCCGISVQRDVSIEQQIEEGTRRTSSGTPIMTSLFSGRNPI